MTIDPTANIGLLRLAMSDPEKFGELMARSGSEPPEPRKVKTETIRPSDKTPAQRVTGGFLDISRPPEKGDLTQMPGAGVTQTRRKAFGESLADVLGEPGLRAAPDMAKTIDILTGNPSDMVAPRPEGPNIFDPVPMEQQAVNLTTTAPEAATTGTSQVDTLMKALRGVRAPEQPQQPNLPMASPPSINYPSAPSAPSMSAPSVAGAPGVAAPPPPARGGGNPQQQLIMQLLSRIGMNNPMMGGR